jgi:hypothetical protein
MLVILALRHTVPAILHCVLSINSRKQGNFQQSNALSFRENPSAEQPAIPRNNLLYGDQPSWPAFPPTITSGRSIFQPTKLHVSRTLRTDPSSMELPASKQAIWFVQQLLYTLILCILSWVWRNTINI